MGTSYKIVAKIGILASSLNELSSSNSDKETSLKIIKKIVNRIVEKIYCIRSRVVCYVTFKAL